MSMRHICAGLLCVSTIVGGHAIAAAAPTTAISFEDGLPRDFTAGLAPGFEFTPTVDLVVTHLGTYDRDNDGLAQDHPTAIYSTATQAVVGSIASGFHLVATSQGTGPNGYFRYVDVPDFTLTAGQSYRIVSYYPANSPDLFIGGFYTNYSDAPEIGASVPGYYAEFVGGLAYPMVHANYPGPAWAGPNFLFEVPEPASMTLLLTGAALALRRHRG